MTTRAEVEARLAKAIDLESLTGLRRGPGSEMAPVAFRRWLSFSRRHHVKQPTEKQRIHDLAKGLQARIDPNFTPLSEYLHLAELLAEVFSGCGIA